ncbi:MAG TPA: PAS domain S-box protein [Ktedonobacteraceae bacterium]|nr:PAS domain S-box protein [Ktedonobacteraceae bacterium]
MMSVSHSSNSEDTSLFTQQPTASSSRLLAVMQRTADLFWILTAVGEMNDISPGWLSFTGQEERGAGGRGWLDAVYASDRPRLEAIFTQPIDPDRVLESDCHIRRKDGVYRLMHLRLFPVCTQGRTVCEFVISSVDMTAEQMNEAQIHLALETSGVGLWRYDLATQQFVATEQWKRLYGLPPAAPVTFKTFLTLVHPDDRAHFEEIISQARARRASCQIEFRIMWPDESVRWLTSQLQCVADASHRPDHLIGSVMDITELKAAEERVISILESITEAFLCLDQEWRVTYANHRISTLTGLNWGEFLGQSLWNVRPQLRGTFFEQQLRAAMETRQASHFEFFASHTQKWADVRVYPTGQEDLSLYVSDITERKNTEAALRESEARFRHLVDSNMIGIIVQDLEGNILESNDQFLSLIDAAREDLTAGSLRVSHLTPESHRTRDRQAREELLVNGTYMPFEKVYRTKRGKLVPVMVGGTLLQSEGTTSPLILSFVVDLSAQKEMERQKEFFMGMTGHELKMPLTALKGSFQLLQRQKQRLLSTRPYLDPEMRAFFETLSERLAMSTRQVDVQTRLINDLLDISRIQANVLQLTLRPCDLVSLVATTVNDLRAAVPERTLRLELPEQIAAIALVDQDRIRQVITNYVTNAVRYSPPTLPIVVGLTLQENMARVWVRDQGPGLSPEEQNEVWQCYRQIKGVPAQRDSGKGLGLGLYICQMLIRQQHGEVGVESVVGDGATFWFTLSII